MIENKKIYFILIFIVLLGSFLFNIYLGIKDFLLIQALRKNGELTNGRVVENMVKGTKGNTKVSVAKYQVDNVSYKIHTRYNESEFRLQEGDTVEILYNKKNPNEAVIKTDKIDLIYFLPLKTSLVLLIIMILMIFFRRKIYSLLE